MMRWVGTRKGQALLEYAILIAAVTLGLSMVARFVSERVSEHGKRIEEKSMVF